MGESKYKVGDEVIIKNLRNASSCDYRFGLNDTMREASEESFTIRSIELATASPRGIPDDGYRYDLEGSRWSWASSMFEDTTKGESTNIDAFISKKKCPVLDFTLH